MDMHMAFRLHDARKNAIEVFAGLFLIVAVLAAAIELQRLQFVA